MDERNEMRLSDVSTIGRDGNLGDPGGDSPRNPDRLCKDLFVMTKKQSDELVREAYEAGKRSGVIQGLQEAQKNQEAERKKLVLDANLKLANSLGQMVNAVSEAIRAFTSDNNTLK